MTKERSDNFGGYHRLITWSHNSHFNEIIDYDKSKIMLILVFVELVRKSILLEGRYRVDDTFSNLDVMTFRVSCGLGLHTSLVHHYRH
jgi:hypothetical protein